MLCLARAMEKTTMFEPRKKNRRITLYGQIHVDTTLKFLTVYGKAVIFTNLNMKGDILLLALMGKHSCKAYDFRIKVGNVQLDYFCSFKST